MQKAWKDSTGKTAISSPNQKLRSFAGTTENQRRLEGKGEQGDLGAQKKWVEVREMLRKKQP